MTFQTFSGVSPARLVVLALAVAVAPAALADHGEIDIGRRANGQLHVSLAEFPSPFGLDPSFFPGFPGFATGELGLVSAVEDHPADDFFLLSPNADIELVLVSASPGIHIYNGLSQVPVGGAFPCGNPIFHLHPIVNVPAGGLGQMLSMTFFVRDASNTHSASEQFTLQFETVPAPGAASVLLAGLAFAARRRR